MLLYCLCFLSLFQPALAAGIAPASFIYAGCSPTSSQNNTPFRTNLASLLTSITSAASRANYNSFTAGDAYGLYQCRGDLGSADCSSCVDSAVAQLGLVCRDAYAGSLQLSGCLVRYGSDNFIGRADRSVAYRKCSSSSSGDGEFLRRRDEVLGGLQSAPATGFKAASSGNVEGYVQCVGDVNAAECNGCLGQAVAVARSSCGAAMAGEVFLVQCCVRYWESGYDFRSAQDYSDDDVGRTVAIIVGILAGFALFVVFISFLRRACKFLLNPHP